MRCEPPSRPLLGGANQLMATTALAVGSAYLWRLHPGRRRYALCTLLPMVAVGSTTLTAAFLSIRDNFLKMADRAQGLIDAGCAAVLMACTVILLLALLRRLLQRAAT